MGGMVVLYHKILTGTFGFLFFFFNLFLFTLRLRDLSVANLWPWTHTQETNFWEHDMEHSFGTAGCLVLG